MSKQFTFKQEAICLISYNPESKKYVLNDEALQFLQSVPGPIGVVGVAGMYRTGKSYLLNQMLLNRSDGFGVGPTVNPCTKGIWVWGKPILGQTPDGETVHILVIDSEGIGALDEDSTHDSRIFALTILLSSVFLYNSVGSIDENAVMNLSLIANLTKNIQIKAKGPSSNNVTSSLQEQDSSDYEDFAQYFPAFFWVLRDFALQLVDDDGEQLLPKQYLEKALAPTKGFSEAAEAKNRIRTLLTSLFKERDCATLIRPLTNEQNLQNLDKTEFDKLRPEFFEQVINLRKKIMNRMKLKTIQGQPLTGQMYSDLIRSYCSAINGGASPNIESAWNYICQNECSKAVVVGTETYDQVIKDVLHNKLPTTHDDLRLYHKMAKDSAINAFKQKAVGQDDVSEEFIKELCQKIRSQFQIIKSENQRESQRICASFISIEFTTIERKLKMNQYKAYSEYEQDLSLFYNYFMETGPRAVNKDIFISQFLHRASIDGANYFFKTLGSQNQLQRTLADQTIKKYENDVKTLRQELARERTQSRSKQMQFDTLKSQMEQKQRVLSQKINQLCNDKDRLVSELGERSVTEKSEMNKIMNELKSKLVVAEQLVREMERQSVMEQSQFEKQRALLNQKLTHYEQSLEELRNRQKEQTNELKTLRKDSFTQLQELSAKYEVSNKSMVQKLNELQERIQELQNDLILKEQRFDVERKKLQLNETNLTAQIRELASNNDVLEKELRELRTREERAIDNLRMGQGQKSREVEQRLSSILDEMRTQDEQIAQLKNSSEQEKALLNQKLEFCELQVQEGKKQLEENQRAHSAIMRALQTNNSSSSSDSTRTKQNQQQEQMRDSHSVELRKIETEFENNKQRLLLQIEQLTEKNHQLEMRVKFETADLNKEIDSLKEQLSNAEQSVYKRNEDMKALEMTKAKISKELQDRYLGQIRVLEDQLEDLQQRTMKEMKDQQTQSEESLTQLKNIYQLQRQTLERRIQEEREKYEKKLQLVNEQLYDKQRSDQTSYQEEIQNLKEDIREQEAQYHNVVQQYEHEVALKQQTIETLEKYIRETQQSLLNVQSQNNLTLEQHINNFNGERKQLLSKIDTLSAELTQKEKEVLQLSQKKEYLESTLAQREQIIQQVKEQFNEERKQLSDQLEQMKLKFQKTSDQSLQQRIESSREIALSNQRNEFLNKKNEDLNKQIENLTTRYEEKLKLQKQELSGEMDEKLVKLVEEQNNIDSQYEKAKQTLKEIESTYNQQLSALQREKAICQQKLTNLESKRSQTDGKLLSENHQKTAQILQMKEQFSAEKKSLLSELDKYKNFNLNLEQQKNQLQTNYERDKALWEGKFAFLEQQKEQAQQDLVDALKQFEVTLTHLQKARNNEKDEHQSNLNELLLTMEQQYQSQIAEINENSSRSNMEYEDRIKRLNKEIKQMKERMMVDQFGNAGTKMHNEKKLAQLLENEQKWLQEIDNLKADRDGKVHDLQRALENERDIMKARISEIEAKYKEAESKRNGLIFEHEKEKAKWNLDKDHLICQKNEFCETIDRLEKKKELLLRENEKLRNESRITRRSINLAAANNNNNLNGNTGGGLNGVKNSSIQPNKNMRLNQSPISSTNTPTGSTGLLNKQPSLMSNPNDKNLFDITNNINVSTPIYDHNQSYSNYSKNSTDDDINSHKY